MGYMPPPRPGSREPAWLLWTDVAQIVVGLVTVPAFLLVVATWLPRIAGLN